MKSFSRIIFAALVVLFIYSCSDSTSDSPTRDDVNALIQKISDSLRHDIKISGYDSIDVNAPLVVIDVVDYKNNKSYYSANGYADIESKRGFEREDLFRVGSITKTFVATEVLILADRGMLRLDDTLSKYYTNIRNANRITIRQLMNMTAGINDFAMKTSFRLALISEPLANKKPEELVNFVSQDEPACEPGAEYHYSSTNFVLLGIIVEKATGKKLGKCIEDDILTPLQLKNTYFPSSHVFPTGRIKAVSGYYFFSAENYKYDVSEFFSDTWAWGAGAMISCIPDLQVWGKALANGALISAEMRAERDKTVGSDVEYMRYGLGTMFSDGYIGHSGIVPGYLSASLYSPSRDVSIVVLINYNMGSTLDIFHRLAILL